MCPPSYLPRGVNRGGGHEGGTCDRARPRHHPGHRGRVHPRHLRRAPAVPAHAGRASRSPAPQSSRASSPAALREPVYPLVGRCLRLGKQRSGRGRPGHLAQVAKLGSRVPASQADIVDFDCDESPSRSATPLWVWPAAPGHPQPEAAPGGPQCGRRCLRRELVVESAELCRGAVSGLRQEPCLAPASPRAAKFALKNRQMQRLEAASGPRHPASSSGSCTSIQGGALSTRWRRRWARGEHALPLAQQLGTLAWRARRGIVGVASMNGNVIRLSDHQGFSPVVHVTRASLSAASERRPRGVRHGRGGGRARDEPRLGREPARPAQRARPHRLRARAAAPGPGPAPPRGAAPRCGVTKGWPGGPAETTPAALPPPGSCRGWDAPARWRDSKREHPGPGNPHRLRRARVSTRCWRSRSARSAATEQRARRGSSRPTTAASATASASIANGRWRHDRTRFGSARTRGSWHGFREGREFETSLCGRARFGVARRGTAGRPCKVCEHIWAKRYPNRPPDDREKGSPHRPTRQPLLVRRPGRAVPRAHAATPRCSCSAT